MENMEMELNVAEKTNEEVEQELDTKEFNESTEEQQIVESNENVEEEKKPEPTVTETPSMIEIVYPQPQSLKKEKSDLIEPDCCYWECCTNEFCDKCSRKCNGRIKAKGHKAQTMDQSKMCLRLEGDPDVYYITKKEFEKLLTGDKVAYLEVKIDPRVVKDNFVRVFFGVKDDEK